jgi:hypothetical protein
MSAQVSLSMPLKADLPPGSTNYSIVVDASNFSADHMILGQRLDAATLHITATPQGFQFKNDVKVGGAPANLEYHQARGDTAADIRLSGMLDAAARSNLGLDPTNAISGTVPIHLSGRPRRAFRRRGRSYVRSNRWLLAGLGKTGRQTGARDVYARHKAAIGPHRRSGD